MKIVHVSGNTPGRNAKGGGLVFMWQNIMALAELGHEIHLVIGTPRERLDEDLQRVAASVTYGVPIPPSRRSLDWLLARLFRAETMFFRFPGWMGIRQQCVNAIERIGPDLIWADWIGSLARVPEGPPLVYGHLDFLHLLKAVRERAHKKLVRRPDILTERQLREAELALVRRASCVASVCATDIETFEGLGIPSWYVPVVGQPIPAPSEPMPERARAFLLGRSNTAMNMSRRNLMEGVWPALGDRRKLLEWHQIGEIPSQATDGWRWVENHFQVHGYVEDLSKVLRPSDLCLVPYRDATGFRAKFVTAAGHGMVNIGYRDTFEVAEEFAAGVNCLAAESHEAFADLLAEYALDRDMRERLSRASRALYEERFSLAAYLNTYSEILSVATG